MEFLWFGVVPGHYYGHRAVQLPKIGFVPDSNRLAFGFLDLSLMLRGCHLIPAFNDGWTSDLLMVLCTVACPLDEDDGWAAFCINVHILFSCITTTFKLIFNTLNIVTAQLCRL